MANGTANIALLIDADNASPAGIDAVLTVLAELGAVNIRRAYGNWAKTALSGWSGLAHQYAIEPQQQFDVTKGKNATDMKMVIDAMDLLYSGRVDGFGIMSSDSDFAPLVMRLRQNGLPIYGFGTEKTPQSFRQACTRFIDVTQLPSDAPTESPKPKPVDEEVIALLSDAWKASKRDEKGFASLSEVGQRAGNRSSFDARNYGATRLSELVERLPNFEIEKRDSGLFLRRVR
ncbi:NYN domain-containing protein [Sandaracinobacter sp. RS1-74]|uniref:NYN domain-containing protein n=1 Tax=Sandaracinobacteroides sayramensis TaxID=2913411 RepID=UPI001EDB54DA|nr:NYN domain-containing protein [Sandaracinobacteroides sayramensis]MCG2840384.1 NYN domain-containing protein [Sandaracinobacteroides sayramensis]